jgi:ABC-type transporter Mla MlaB component
MPVENEIIDGRNRIRICGALSIWEAAATWREVFALLGAAVPLEIDMTAVENCDGAGIQILCQIQKALAARTDQSRITGLSDGLREAMRVAGLNADVGWVGQGEA